MHLIYQYHVYLLYYIAKVKQYAEKQNVRIISSKIIYEALDEIKKMILAKLPDLYEKQKVGSAIVKRVFDIGLKGSRTMKVAGSICTNGKINSKSLITVKRKGEIIQEYLPISSLKSFKKEVERIDEGEECGIGILGYNVYLNILKGIMENDELEIFDNVKVERKI